MREFPHILALFLFAFLELSATKAAPLAQHADLVRNLNDAEVEGSTSSRGRGLQDDTNDEGIISRLRAIPSLRKFVGLLDRGGTTNNLPRNKLVTVFAPTDSSWDSPLGEEIESLDNEKLGVYLLMYFMEGSTTQAEIAAELAAPGLENAYKIDSIAGQPLQLWRDVKNYMYIAPNLWLEESKEYNEGIVHLINGTLPFPTTPTPSTALSTFSLPGFFTPGALPFAITSLLVHAL